MKVFGASIDSVRVLSGYGQELERSSRVPESYVWVEVDLGLYETADEASEALAAWEAPRGAMDAEVSIETMDDGRERATAGYWGPPGEESDPWRTVGLVMAMAGAGLSAIGIGIALMESQY